MHQKLKELQETNLYLFHGSSTGDIVEFTPRQAHSFGKPDGDPAIFAAECIEPPIFMAVLGSRKTGGWGLKELPGYGFYIRETDWIRAKAEHWSGYVYIFLKKDFIHYTAWEWRSQNIVKPLKSFKVDIGDLPSEITVMKDKDFERFYDQHSQGI